MQSDKSHENLARERSRASFPIRLMTNYLDGGDEATAKREQAMGFLEDPKYAKALATTSIKAKREQTRERIDTLFKLFFEHSLEDVALRRAMVQAFGAFDMSWYVRNGVSHGLFASAITSQGTREQQNHWLFRIMMQEIFGSFSMTELGHGSNVKALETTATYDPVSHSFEIHTPIDTATKWLIGGMAETSTHTACFAQLIVQGVNHGIQCFVVPLRNEETGQPLPNIKLGDIGGKMGNDGIDNGWLQFHHVRIPYDHWLHRHAQIVDNVFTKFSTDETAKPSRALVTTRAQLVELSISLLKKAVTIAVRYGAVRRQGYTVDKSVETLLLDYPSHQLRLMPVLATVYAYHFQAAYMEDLVDSPLDDAAAEFEEMHGTTAGLKAFCTWDTLRAMEECRQCCGGNGYLSMNGLSSMVADFSVMVTWEGDNTVMAQQTAQYVCRAMKRLAAGENVSLGYLKKQPVGSWSAVTPKDVLASPKLREIVGFYAAAKAKRVYDQYAPKLAGGDENQVWLDFQIEWIEVARIHVFYEVATKFLDKIEHLAGHPSQYSPLVPVLSKLASLFVLKEVESNGVFFVNERFLTKSQYELVHDAVLRLCKDLRQDAVPLVDSFHFSDTLLNSCIGVESGKVYDQMLKHVKLNSKI